MVPLRLSLVLAASLLLSACKEESAGAGDAGAADAAGQGIALASGGTARLQEVVSNAPGAEGAAARFRFVLPELTAVQDRSADMQVLCDSYALPRVQGTQPMPVQIIISLADREIPFGEAAPDAVQFFEAYRIQGDRCIWEMF